MNQCDGCRAGWEVRNGLHYDRHGRVQMGCTAKRYPLSVNAIKTLPNGDTEGFSMFTTNMVPEQARALVLADELLDGMNDEHWNQLNADAAKELRRLHAENETLWNALDSANSIVQYDTEIMRRVLNAIEQGESFDYLENVIGEQLRRRLGRNLC